MLPNQSQCAQFDRLSVPNPISACWVQSWERTKKNLLDGRKLVPQHFPIQWDAHWYPGTLPNPMGCRSQKNRIFENFISPRQDLYIEPKTKNRRRDLGQSLKHISCFWKNTCSPCETGCFAPEHFYDWILLPSAQSL